MRYSTWGWELYLHILLKLVPPTFIGIYRTCRFYRQFSIIFQDHNPWVVVSRTSSCSLWDEKSAPIRLLLLLAKTSLLRNQTHTWTSPIERQGNIVLRHNLQTNRSTLQSLQMYDSYVWQTRLCDQKWLMSFEGGSWNFEWWFQRFIVRACSRFACCNWKSCCTANQWGNINDFPLLIDIKHSQSPGGVL